MKKKSHFNVQTVLWGFSALSIIWSLFGFSGSLLDIFKIPLRSLFGSHRALDTQVLEVSGNVESVKKATRQLLQPWGAVHLSRRVSSSTTPDAPPPATLASPPPTDPNVEP